jgi:ribosomal-protein-alanine N-acetyltransferase
MRRRHLNQVLAIEHQVYSSGWSRSIFLNELLFADRRRYSVAKVGRRVAGDVGVMFAPDEGHITTVAVHPDWQRRGIATRLMVHALEVTREAGLDAMTLEVRVSNRAAQSMYEQLGFSSVGVRPGYYVDNREDAMIMWVQGISSPEYQARLVALLDALALGGET